MEGRVIDRLKRLKGTARRESLSKYYYDPSPNVSLSLGEKSRWKKLADKAEKQTEEKKSKFFLPIFQTLYLLLSSLWNEMQQIQKIFFMSKDLSFFFFFRTIIFILLVSKFVIGYKINLFRAVAEYSSLPSKIQWDPLTKFHARRHDCSRYRFTKVPREHYSQAA